MISVGVDVSKGKSTVCILKPYGEILMAPKDYAHTQSDIYWRFGQFKNKNSKGKGKHFE